jgi:hypothetical protein
MLRTVEISSRTFSAGAPEISQEKEVVAVGGFVALHRLVGSVGLAPREGVAAGSIDGNDFRNAPTERRGGSGALQPSGLHPVTTGLRVQAGPQAALGAQGLYSTVRQCNWCATPRG